MIQRAKPSPPNAAYFPCAYLLAILILLTSLCTAAAAAEKPNILLILADDLGYGDVTCYHPDSKIQTTDFLYAYIDGDRVPNPPSAMIDKSRYPKNPYTNDFREGLK